MTTAEGISYTLRDIVIRNWDGNVEDPLILGVLEDAIARGLQSDTVGDELSTTEQNGMCIFS